MTGTPDARQGILILRAGGSPPLPGHVVVRPGLEVPVWTDPILSLDLCPEEADRFGARLAEWSTGEGGADWVAFTSRHTVEFLKRRGSEKGRWTAWRDALLRVPVGSIGPATTEALVGEGIPVGVEASPSTTRRLAEELRARGARRVLLPRSRSATPEMENILRSGGVEVESVAIYESRPDPEALSRTMAHLRRRDVAALGFTSAQEVRTFLAECRRAGTDPRSLLEGIRLGALGPVTREELSLAGLSSTMSETTRVSSMVLMLARAIGEGT